MPKTQLGKWSVGLMVALVVLWVFLTLLALSGHEGGEKFSDNLLIAIPAFLALISAVASFIVGLVSIIKKRERSWLVYVATFIGLAVMIFILGDLIVPQ